MRGWNVCFAFRLMKAKLLFYLFAMDVVNPLIFSRVHACRLTLWVVFNVINLKYCITIIILLMSGASGIGRWRLFRLKVHDLCLLTFLTGTIWNVLGKQCCSALYNSHIRASPFQLWIHLDLFYLGDHWFCSLNH